MKKVILSSLALIFLTLASDSIHAQNKDDEKKPQPTTTTVDAWREAAPLNEQPIVVTAAPNEASEAAESNQQIEKRVSDLETRLAESLKTSDSATLRQLLADDFVPVGRSVLESQTGKNGFIDWVLKNGEHKSFTVEKMKVRVYGTDMAIATVQYKKVTSGAPAATDGGFVATDVWVKRENFWQVASHHISPLPKP
jgi:ketosteroid isomerase-like protein